MVRLLASVRSHVSLQMGALGVCLAAVRMRTHVNCLLPGDQLAHFSNRLVQLALGFAVFGTFFLHMSGLLQSIQAFHLGHIDLLIVVLDIDGRIDRCLGRCHI
ncbi:hypothetical protein BpHYR1_036656 [Brachionus plicatilis]|uniref:Uncharacterized protein n=1 Tax=Brachionus plicatilis TaxID=10195 RepID=A0A3M7SMZ5_BRAPC|nr:hypothetical protein BpHYR1_036656 [Brachionus plicatilis]